MIRTMQLHQLLCLQKYTCFYPPVTLLQAAFKGDKFFDTADVIDAETIESTAYVLPGIKPYDEIARLTNGECIKDEDNDFFIAIPQRSDWPKMFYK